MEKVVGVFGYKFKCPWCGFQHYTDFKHSLCAIATCPVYREAFKIVHDPVVCLACSRSCTERKITAEEILHSWDPALRGVKL
jgi:hypothetical protein